jgi:hypothetical protein
MLKIAVALVIAGQAGLLTAQSLCIAPVRVVDPTSGRISTLLSGPLSPEYKLSLRWSSDASGVFTLTLSASDGAEWMPPSCTPEVILPSGRRFPLDGPVSRGASLSGSIFVLIPGMVSERGPLGVRVCQHSYEVSATMRCGIMTMAQIVQADASAITERRAKEAEEREARSAPPLPSVEQGEPFGIALQGGMPIYRLSWQTGGRTEAGNVRVLWGMLKGDLLRQLGTPPQSKYGPFEDAMTCTPDSLGVETCFTSPAAPWFVDFGTVGGTPFLRFKDGHFFAYSATFRVESFSQVKEALLKRLGAPVSDATGTVQNRMGATFEQESITWKLPHVVVSLTQRGTDVNTSLLTGSYLPIAETLPPPPEAKAPM